MRYKLQDLIDIQQFQALQDRLNEVYSFPSAIIDNNGNILTATAWQDVCMKFHRQNKDCKKECIKSDQYILSHIEEANPAVSYRCPHGLVDNATPIIIDGVHLGSFFTGQFFLEEPDLEFFRAQAKRYGFDEAAYLEAVRKVPVWTQEKLDSYLFFIKGLIEVISGIGLKKLRAIEARQKIGESERRFQAMFEMASIGIVQADPITGQWLRVNQKFCEITGYTAEELLALRVPEITHPEDREKDWEAFQRVARGEAPNYRLEKRYIRKDGLVVWVNVNMTVIRDDSGQPVHTMATIEDITERKRVEDALKESEERFRTMFELATVGMAQGDPSTGRLERVNSRLCEITGYSADELIGRKFSEITHPGDREREWECFQSAVKGEIPAYRMEKRYVRKDGTLAWVNVNATVLRDLSGKAFRSMAVIEDITERKRSEESLRESEERHRVLFEGSPHGILAADIETKRFAFANPSMCQMLGYTEAELLRLGMGDIHPKPDLDSVVTEFMSLVRGEKKLSSALPCLRKDGTVFYADVAGTSTTIQGRKYLVGFFADVTERKRSEAERTLLATAVEQAEENVLVTDERRTILYVNPAFERSSGYRLEELQGRKLRVLRSAQHDEAFYQNMKGILDRGEVWMGVIINKGRDGTDFEIEGSISPIRDASTGAITHFVAAGRNMSRFRKLERELYQAQKMESVGRLAGGVAHDFNNMLGVILGHAELALRQIDSAQAAYLNLQEIKKAAHRSANLIRQLLAFARKQTISPKVLDINETVESMLQMVRRLIGEDIELLWKPGEDVWPVKVDPTQIDQILANLCVNARDAIAGVGEVIIETSNVSFDDFYNREHEEVLPGEYVLLAVSDNGCGMEKQVLDKLFEPFFTTKEVGKGTGLGLATVYGIVKQNRGFIDVQSELDRGTTFRIFLPRTVVTVREEQPSRHQNENLTGTETVLLVEDEESLLELGKRTLEHHGYLVLAAHHPAQALVLAKDYPGRIDILITDVIMPGMNGKELTERLGSFKSGFRTIFMSGYTSDVIAQHDVLDDGVNFLQKPFSIQSLAAKVREVLDT